MRTRDKLMGYVFGGIMAFTPLALAGSVSLRHIFTPGTRALASEVNANFTDLVTAINDNHARIAALEARPTPTGVSAPVGAIVCFAGDASNAPLDWLPCDGRMLNSSQYPALYAVLGSLHGTSGAAGDFRLPDLRGRFVRGVSGGSGHDPQAAQRVAASAGAATGDRVGTLQAWATAAPVTVPMTVNISHVHTYNTSVYQPGNWGPQNVVASNIGPGDRDTSAVVGTPLRNVTGGDSETRPANIALEYIIKAR